MVARYMGSNGMVAVIHSTKHRSGWISQLQRQHPRSTQEDMDRLLCHPDLVEWVLSPTHDDGSHFRMALRRAFPEKPLDWFIALIPGLAARSELGIHWVRPDDQFTVLQYDGLETVIALNDHYWMKALP